MTTAAPAGLFVGLGARRFRAMGTDVTVLLPAARDDAAGAVERLMDAWDRRFSRFRPDSELMALNRAAGTPFAASDTMYEAASAALAAAQATDGLFDPLLFGRMVELGYDRTFDELPADGTAAPLREWHAGEWRSVRLDPVNRTVTLPAGSGIDLGGLAKGMAVDAAVREMAAAGIDFAAVNAGGDLAVIGTPPGLGTWDVEIEGVAEAISLSSGALATSSVLRRRWMVRGQVRHHLIDPRTGLPVENEIAQVSVAAATCVQAEVAAKAVFLLGTVAGTAFVERHGLSALVVTRSGEELRLGAWRP
jgi:thiamine biosynthesis lipoprotein